MGAIDSSPSKRSPAAVGAMTLGTDQSVKSLATADVKKICASPFTISAYATSRRPRTGSNAGAGYDPPARNAPPLRLAQNGGNSHTGFTMLPNCSGALQLAPPSPEALTYSAVPLLP